MTDGQTRYQNVMESKRHNYEMEKLGREERAIKQQEADTARYAAETSRKRVIAQNFRDFTAGGKDAMDIVKKHGETTNVWLKNIGDTLGLISQVGGMVGGFTF